MKYAVITSGGKQYKVSEGDVVLVDKIEAKEKDSYTFPQVLLFVDGETRKVGTPTVAGVSVVGTVMGQKKTRKVRVAKFKAKAKYRRVTGFRASVTEIKIDSIKAGK